MRVKVGNNKAARRTLHSYNCCRCPFDSRSIVFCIKISCDEDVGFDDLDVSEDIFKV